MAQAALLPWRYLTASCHRLLTSTTAVSPRSCISQWSSARHPQQLQTLLSQAPLLSRHLHVQSVRWNRKQEQEEEEAQEKERQQHQKVDDIHEQHSNAIDMQEQQHQQVVRWADDPLESELLTYDTTFKDEVLQAIAPCEGDVVLDMTFGSGGHSALLLESCPGVRVLAVDRDPSTRQAAEQLQQQYPGRLCYLNIKFSEVGSVLTRLGVAPRSLAGVVLDSGWSRTQLHHIYGQSGDQPLDLRMDPTDKSLLDGLEALRFLDDYGLRRMLAWGGVGNCSKRIAEALIQARYEMITIRTPVSLNEFIKIVLTKQVSNTSLWNDKCGEVVSARPRRPSNMMLATTRTIQALGFFVNNSLNELDCGVRTAHMLLRPNACLAAISYNPIEDTIIKRNFSGHKLDRSAETIGKQKHHYAYNVTAEDDTDPRPWEPKSKHKLCPKWVDSLKTARHWQHAILRTAHRNPNSSYMVTF